VRRLGSRRARHACVQRVYNLTFGNEINGLYVSATFAGISAKAVTAGWRSDRWGCGAPRGDHFRITLGQIDKGVESERGVFAMRGQVHEECAVACAMRRSLGPISNAANDAVEQALSKTSLAELVAGIG
jgi:hypothetical protein